jgi:Tfp pilus assembly protein PilV
MDWLLRRRKNRQRGSMLIEAIIAIGLLAYLMLGYTQASAQANKVQRTNVNYTVATQAAAAYIETLRATPGSKIGTNTGPVVPGSVPGDSLPVAGETLPASTKVTARGLDLTLNTTITWMKAPVAASAYGIKRVQIEVVWYDRSGDETSKHTTVQDDVLTPGVDQAAPSGVRGA